MAFTIGVFYHETKGPWKMLSATGDYLTELGHVPNLGDRIAVKSADYSFILKDSEAGEAGQSQSGSMPGDSYKTVVTVTERIYNYSLCDIALVCEYEAF